MCFVKLFFFIVTRNAIYPFYRFKSIDAAVETLLHTLSRIGLITVIHWVFCAEHLSLFSAAYLFGCCFLPILFIYLLDVCKRSQFNVEHRHNPITFFHLFFLLSLTHSLAQTLFTKKNSFNALGWTFHQTTQHSRQLCTVSFNWKSVRWRFVTRLEYRFIEKTHTWQQQIIKRRTSFD